MNVKIMIWLLVAGILRAQSAVAETDPSGTTAISKATELGVHRIDRLAHLPNPANPGHNKLEAMFVDNLYAMKAERSSEGGATFKIHGYVSPDANNQTSSVTMLSDQTGKILSHSAIQTFMPVNAELWPEKDALTLMEDALHFVLEGWIKTPDVKQFYSGLNMITLSRAQDSGGKLIALATVTSVDDARTLYIRLKTDGTFLSHEIR
jgi:hypothetical protein